ncbi:MAG: energy transducer TonB [Gammaproteobacteria bacterium]|nr:energy transducer TonB [Gammaproteobacteria bacterium]
MITRIRPHHWFLALVVSAALHAAAVVTLHVPPLSQRAAAAGAIQVSFSNAVPKSSSSVDRKMLNHPAIGSNVSSETNTEVLYKKPEEVIPTAKVDTELASLDSEQQSPAATNALMPMATERTTAEPLSTERVVPIPDEQSRSHRDSQSQAPSKAIPTQAKMTGAKFLTESQEVFSDTDPSAAALRQPTADLLSAGMIKKTPVAGSMETEREPLGEYLEVVRDRLATEHRYPKLAQHRRQKGTAVVKFTVNPRGAITAYEVISSSGYGLLDAEALRLLERVSPLPPFPSDLRRNALVIKMPIAFKLVSAKQN